MNLHFSYTKSEGIKQRNILLSNHVGIAVYDSFWPVLLKTNLEYWPNQIFTCHVTKTIVFHNFN